MKRICIFLTLALLLGSLSGCGSVLSEIASQIKEPTGAETEAPAATASQETGTPAIASDALPDFTVQTVSGDTFTLYDALKTHELVLINLFATWCPPCKMEFPYLEEAWEQSQDRVSVIALSIEPTDTDEMLRDFAEELGLKFPVGHEDGTDLLRFVDDGIPTTLLVDRTGRVAAVEVGAKSSAQAFLDLFDEYSGEDYDPYCCSYRIVAYDQMSYEAVEGVVANFCTDTTCTPVTTDASGVAVFTGAPASYHVQIVKVPEGKQVVGVTDFYTETYGQIFRLALRELDG